ncbi:hypothetical protein SXANM310S_03471 [Streptomyces xanthochromogenes]
MRVRPPPGTTAASASQIAVKVCAIWPWPWFWSAGSVVVCAAYAAARMVTEFPSYSWEGIPAARQVETLWQETCRAERNPRC